MSLANYKAVRKTLFSDCLVGIGRGLRIRLCPLGRKTSIMGFLEVPYNNSPLFLLRVIFILILLSNCSNFSNKILIKYSKSGNLDKIKKILEKDSSLFDFQLINIAISNNDQKMVEYLIPFWKDKKKDTDNQLYKTIENKMVVNTIENGNKDIFHTIFHNLIDDYNYQISLDNFEGAILDKAVELNNEWLIDYLLKNGSLGIWALCYAVKSNDLSLVKKVVDSKTPERQEWDFALVVAVQQGSFEIIKYLIEDKNISPSIYFEWKDDYPVFVKNFYELYQVDKGGGFSDTAMAEALRFMNMTIVDYLRSKGGQTMTEQGFKPNRLDNHHDHIHDENCVHE